MSLRRRIAERIATPLKRAGVETPILDQIPHRAEEITAFYYEAVQQSSRGQLELLRIPAFAHGKAYGETVGLWYRVTFPKIIKNPTVVCVGEGRKTTLRKRVMDKIPDIEIPTIDIAFPRGYFVVLTADDFINGIKQFLGDWSIFNWLRDAIAWAYGNTEYWGYSLVTKRLAESLNEALDNIYKIFDRVRTSINDSITRVNARIETVRTRVNEITGELIPDLYEAWGIPEIMALTALHIRNVTSTGFEFQSYGKTTAYWICLGTRA